MRLPTAEGVPSLLYRHEPVPTKETAAASLACSSAGDVATKGK